MMSKSEGINRLWIVAFVVILAVLAGIIWQSQAARVFTILEGQGRVLVLIRSQEEVEYRLRYIGRQPVSLQRVQLNYKAGPDLTIFSDVTTMSLELGDQVVVLDELGSVPAGSSFELQPQDEFVLRITYHGRQLGSNRLDSFWLTYLRDGSEKRFELTLPDTVIVVE